MDIENSSKSKVDKNFIETIRLFQKKNIFYWLCHGTLLGIVRDNELIPWDHDIDIAVWSDDSKRQEIIDIMSANSYELKEKYFLQEDLLTFCKKGGREVDINFYKIKDNNDNKKIAYVEWFVPKNNFYKIIDALSKSKTYQGKFKFIINKLSFFENFFLMIKKALIKKQYFLKVWDTPSLTNI